VARRATPPFFLFHFYFFIFKKEVFPMISGNIHEASDLTLLPEPLQRAVQFLKDTDLAAHEPGRFALDGDRMILQVLDQTTAARETLRPECHRKYIDVQFLAAGGPERIGWYPDLGDNEVDE